MKASAILAAALITAVALIESSCAPALSAQEAQSKPRPAWMHDMPIVIVSNHDSMPIFRRRVGGNTTWQEEDYEKEHTEETVRKLKELGVTLVITHFYKGFGLEAERRHQQKALQLAALVRKYGMRLGVYVGSTIAYETFLTERPDAEEWFVPDYLGRPVFYSDQTFRKRVYFMHPGYRDYMRRVLTLAEKRVPRRPDSFRQHEHAGRARDLSAPSGYPGFPRLPEDKVHARGTRSALWIFRFAICAAAEIRPAAWRH